jgi:hypothetical protein
VELGVRVPASLLGRGHAAGEQAMHKILRGYREVGLLIVRRRRGYVAREYMRGKTGKVLAG